MKTEIPRKYGHASIWRPLLSLLLLAGFCQASHAAELTINVVGPNGAAIAGGYRWLVEEDATKAVDFTPAQPGRDLSLSFHTSYMPVAGKGDSATGNTIQLDSTKRYYVSVLPKIGYQMGGAAVAAGGTSVTITVNPAPTPTAQISVFAFNDNQPINNAPDLPQELGLAGFSVLLFEPGGTYGMSGGQVTQDAHGNPLGTTYNAAGDVITRGDSTLRTGADGTLLIKNLSPGKYGIQIVPPAGSNWHQTSTLEGSKTIDAWVKANEPSYFQEFGPPGHHVFIGFVQSFKSPVLNGSGSITGTVVNLHNSRPPNYAFFNGHAIANCWVGLNELEAAGGRGLYAGPCNADSSFAITNVPAGDYQLVIWDEYLGVIFATHSVTMPRGVNQVVALQEVPVFYWFSRIESVVFYDGNQNGLRDEGEAGIPEQAVNLRFRDGSIYQAFPTDLDGYVPFDEVFPFFNWLIAEVDFTRFKATGATIAVDGGGAIDESEYWSYGGKLNPQLQVCTAEDVAVSVLGCAAAGDTRLSRTEAGQVLTQAFQGFLGQSNVLEWGKVNYAAGENGGISGVVQYATTRAEDDPRMAAAELWEPGIPRVQVNLYRDANGDKIIDDTGTDGVTLADVDNHPFGNFPGAEDVERSGTVGVFDQGDAIAVVTTDSWDDNLPSGCQGEVYVANGQPTDCFDGLRNFNQVRPGVFDGGYAFNTIMVDGVEVPIPAGTYIVEAITPPGYETLKEEDKNVDFGDAYKPAPLALPVECVGDLRIVPPVLSLFPDQAVGAAYAGQNRPLCDRKQVVLAQRLNGAANFFMFTEVPVAAHIVGMILNDTANEFDPNAPTFGEKQAPSFVPVSIRDWTGREITRVYSDQYGNFNALVPSTFSMNLPMPSGVAPNMLTACMNSPLLPNGTEDPHFDRQYSQFCYTFQYMPGKTTYLDTPVVPIAAFAGPGQFPVDCEFPDGTPTILWASGDNGPWVPTAGVARAITIASLGSVEVANPDYDGTAATPRKIARDFGFGATSGSVTINGTPIAITAWTPGSISATIPAGTANGSYQLMVTRGDNGAVTKTGLTFTVGGGQPTRVAPGGSIQAAIDAAGNGSPLILVPTGNYEELVIMHKPVRLQGWGLGTKINAVKAPAEKLANWRAKLASLLSTNQFSLLPGQEVAFNAPDNEPVLFGTEEGPGVLVLGNANGQGNANEFGPTRIARIDGFTITGADHGGGVFASGYARNLQVSNNRIVSNQGTYGGGVRIGHATLLNGAVLTNSQNSDMRIHFNQISQNGSLQGAGGGIALYTGASGYQVSENLVCGNFSTGHGGGVGHLGLSNNGTIAKNTIVFNQTFNQGVGVNGGGIFIGGAAPIAPAVLGLGSGTVNVLGNLIQGNQAGAGDGGGIRAQSVNGTDVRRSPNSPGAWYRINIDNNLIVDNMAGLAGGGISLQDSARSFIRHNTVAHNDSTATAGTAFEANSPNQSTPRPAGIVSRAHSSALAAAFNGNQTNLRFFSNPTLTNNIVWQNRSFYWAIDANCDALTSATPCFGLNAAVGTYDDLAVLGTAIPSYLDPRNSILTSLSEGTHTYAASNLSANPLFVSGYFNASPGQTVVINETTTSLATAPAFDEGGNFIDVRFGPLTLTGNYHLTNGSPAEGLGATGTGVNTDVDGQARPQGGTNPDAGADERL